MKSPRLSAPMIRMLEDVRDHGESFRRIHGNSQHGGAGATYRSLVKRGLILRPAAGTSKDRITQAGRDALEYYRRK